MYRRRATHDVAGIERAAQGLKRLLEGNLSSEQKSWLFSLLAESQERAGADNSVSIAYRRSLSLQSDLYTAIAQSDLLLRTGQRGSGSNGTGKSVKPSPVPVCALHARIAL